MELFKKIKVARFLWCVFALYSSYCITAELNWDFYFTSVCPFVHTLLFFAAILRISCNYYQMHIIFCLLFFVQKLIMSCYTLDGTAPTSSVRDLTPVSIENWPTTISLNWQPPRQTNGQITGTFHAVCRRFIPVYIELISYIILRWFFSFNWLQSLDLFCLFLLLSCAHLLLSYNLWGFFVLLFCY